MIQDQKPKTIKRKFWEFTESTNVRLYSAVVAASTLLSSFALCVVFLLGYVERLYAVEFKTTSLDKTVDQHEKKFEELSKALNEISKQNSVISGQLDVLVRLKTTR